VESFDKFSNAFFTTLHTRPIILIPSITRCLNEKLLFMRHFTKVCCLCWWCINWGKKNILLIFYIRAVNWETCWIF
jgi:hypothetical protein